MEKQQTENLESSVALALSKDAMSKLVGGAGFASAVAEASLSNSSLVQAISSNSIQSKLAAVFVHL
jgi:hypothetical protein